MAEANFSFLELHHQYSPDQFVAQEGIEEKATKPQIEPNVKRATIPSKTSPTTSNEIKRMIVNYELVEEAEKIIAIISQRSFLNIPFYTAPPSLFMDEIDRMSEYMNSLLNMMSSKCHLTFLELRNVLGWTYDVLLDQLSDIFGQFDRIKKNLQTTISMTLTYKGMTAKQHGEDSYNKKRKSNHATVLDERQNELKLHIDMLCMWDNQLQSSITEYSATVSSAFQKVISSNAAQLAATQKTHKKVPPIRTYEAISSRNIKASNHELYSQTRSKSVMGFRTQPVHNPCIFKEIAYPEDIDPLLVVWLGGYSFRKYIPLFQKKKLSFRTFAAMTDIDFADIGVESGDDCLAFGMLLGNTQGPENEICVKENYLQKRGKLHKSWKKRLFKLFASYKLYYYSSKSNAHGKALGFIDLLDVLEARSIPPDSFEETYRFSLELVTVHRSWMLSGQDVTINQWHTLITAIMAYCKANGISRASLDNMKE